MRKMPKRLSKSQKKTYRKAQKAVLPPIKAPNFGFWDHFDREVLRKKR